MMHHLLEKLYFERIGGSEKELQAAHVIQDELSKLGIESRLEAFEVTESKPIEAVLEVVEPYQKQYEAYAYVDCLDGDLMEEFYYFESDNKISMKKAEGKIVLVNGYLNMKTFKALTEGKAKGFITYNGHIDYATEDLDWRELRKPLQQFGNIPGVNIRVQDAMEMIEKKASKVRMVVKQDVKKTYSHNVVCDIKGKQKDIMVMTAHYDSVPHSKGAYDNATGSVALYEIAKALKDKTLEHSLRFIWCGSEERGLLGSKAYIQQHQDEIENISLCINIDMIGSLMGKRLAVCTSEEALVHYIDYESKCVGYPLLTSQGVYSSDSTPFADAGVPSISFARMTQSGTGDIHSRYDVLEHLNEDKIREDIQFIKYFVEKMALSYMIPVSKEIPQNMKEEIDKYYGRDLFKKEKD